MLFIGVALLIAAGLALLISSDAGSLIGLTENQTGQLIPLLIILVMVAGGLFGRRRFTDLIGGLALWAGVFAIALVGYTYRYELQDVVARVSGEVSPGVALVNGGTATFRRSYNGHFVVNADVNGTSVPLIFDTGASAVVLTAEDARKAGIDTDELRFDVPVSTANGTGRAATVMLDRIDVGGIERERVRAFIAEDGALETSLLGMTFLDTLTSFGVRDNALEFVD